MVIFGGTGDLTHRKLVPALYNLTHEGMLPEAFNLVAIGRRTMTDEEYREAMFESIEKHSRFKIEDSIWSKLKERIHYKEMDFTLSNDYPELNTYLNTT